jgi:hypothetical protein
MTLLYDDIILNSIPSILFSSVNFLFTVSWDLGVIAHGKTVKDQKPLCFLNI